MNQRSNPKLTGKAQQLRKNMTREERHLWYDFLKRLPVTFNRQKVIDRYIVDFYCAEAKLVIELDGSQHFEDVGAEADRERDAYLRSLGLSVLRYPNSAIWGNFEGVCEDILYHISDGSTSSASLRSAPSPQGEGSTSSASLRSAPSPQGEGSTSSASLRSAPSPQGEGI